MDNVDVPFSNHKTIQKNGMLSDVDIKHFIKEKKIRIETSGKGDMAFKEEQIKLGSIDLRFSRVCRKFKKNNTILTYSSIQKDDYTELFDAENGKLVIEPGEMILTTTNETIILSSEFAGILTGRSSIARLGIMVHCCQEFINPGHGQPIPLQLINVGPRRVELDQKNAICQLVLIMLRSPSSESYSELKDAKYSTEKDVQSSRIYQEVVVSQDETIKKFQFDSKKVKRNLKKWINPIIQSILAAVICSYLIVGSSGQDGIGLSIALRLLKNIPVTVLIVLAIVLVYIWINKGDE